MHIHWQVTEMWIYILILLISDLKLLIRRMTYRDYIDKLTFFGDERQEWTKVISLHGRVRDGKYGYFDNRKMLRQNHDLVYFMQWHICAYSLVWWTGPMVSWNRLDLQSRMHQRPLSSRNALRVKIAETCIWWCFGVGVYLWQLPRLGNSFRNCSCYCCSNKCSPCF